MAYGLKYTGSLIDYFGRTLTVNIYENDYIGTSTTVTLAGVNLTLNGDDENVFKNILSTSVSVGLLSETDFQFIELYTGDKRKYRMDIVRDSVLKWRGWLVPDLYTETYAHSENYITTITARDGLVELETTDFDLTGVKSHDEIIQLGITLVTSDTNDILYVGVNTFEENHVTTESPLSQTFVDCKRYEGLTWNDVFLDICKLYGARLYQKNGDFWFVSTFELKNEFNWTSYNGIQTVVSTGTEDTELVVGLNEADKWANVDQQLNILPPWRELKITSDLGFRDSALENYNFDDWTNDNTPANWTPSTSKQVVKYSQKNNLSALFTTRSTSPSQNNFITQTINNIDNTHGILFSIKFGVVADNINTEPQSQFWVKIENWDGGSNYYYLDSNGIWQSTESYINFQNIDSAANENNLSFREFSINSRGLNASIADIQLSGKIFITIYSADTGALVVDDVVVNMIAYPTLYSSGSFFGDPLGNPNYSIYDDSPSELTPINKQTNNYIPDEIETLTSDLPNIFRAIRLPFEDRSLNEQHVYDGGLFLNSSKSATTQNWGFKTPPIPSVLVNTPLLTSIYSNLNGIVTNPYWAITGTLLTQNLESDSTIIDVAVNSKKYLVSNGDFDLERCQFNGTYIEIGSYSNAAALCVIVDSTGLINDNGTHSDSAIWVD